MAFVHAPKAQEMSLLAVLGCAWWSIQQAHMTFVGTVDNLFQELDFKERMKISGKLIKA